MSVTDRSLPDQSVPEDHSVPEDRSVAAPAGDAAFKRRFLQRLTALSAGGQFIDGYIMGIIGTVIVAVAAELEMSLFWEGLTASAALIGIFLGAPLGGWLSDKFGRRPIFFADLVLFLVGSIAQFFVHEPILLFATRLIMGIAIGAEYSVGWPLLAEFSPARLRGRLLALSNSCWYVGFMVAFIVGYALTRYTDVGWRVILGSSTLLAVVLLVARLGIPESPRWLWSVGRKEEALVIAERYLQSPEDVVDVQRETARKGSIGMLFARENRRGTAFITLFWVCAVLPYFAIATFAQGVLEDYGLADGLAGGVGLTSLATAGVVFCTLFVEKLGRRRLAIYPQWICAVALAVIGLWVGAPALVVLICFFVFSCFNAMCATLTGVFPAEVFPTEIRGIGTGFAAAVSRIGAALGTFLLPWAITNVGAAPAMLVAAAICVVGAIVCQMLAPEMTGRNLSETQHEDRVVPD